MAGQLEQLLTCCICLDRFRNPKLLPCQHSVCMEPCMEGLVDYVRRQVKCPECRAEHRIPYNGVQGFPANVTLQRFLEAHIEITGETPDPFTGQIMERCNVCNEKNYLSICAHCEKKICEDCKSAHGDVLKREIGRINNQVKRAVHRLTDQLRTIDKNLTGLKQNSDNVLEDIDNVTKRLQKALRSRCDFLRQEVENYYATENRHLINTKEGLEQEISNMNSNIELVEKHMEDETPWDDGELMDCKDIFLKTMDFIRTFDQAPGEYARRAKFNQPEEINKLASSLATLGDLQIAGPKPAIDYGGSSSSSSMQSGGLMKSKSDHRLAMQFRDQEESASSYSSGRSSPVRRKFGERPAITETDLDSQSEIGGRRRFKSRFIRRGEEDENASTVSFADPEPVKQRARVLDTEDVSRGPLSNIIRMYDSPRVMKRLQEREMNAKKKKDAPPPAPTPVAKAPVTFGTPAPKKTTRQISEDEIDKIKKQNKNETSSSGSTATATPTVKPPLERLASIKDEERSSRSDRSSVSPRSANHSPSKYDESTLSPSRKTSTDQSSASTFPYTRSSSTSSVGGVESSKTTTGTRSPRTYEPTSTRLSRSDSTDSNRSAVEGSVSPKKSSGAVFSTDEIKNRFRKTNGTTSSSSTLETPSTNYGGSRAGGSSGGSRYHQSRFLGRAGTPSVEGMTKESGNDDDDDDSDSDDSDSEDTEDSSEDEEEDKLGNLGGSKVDTGILLGRSTQNKDKGMVNGNLHNSSSLTDSGYGSRYGSLSNDTSSTGSSKYGSSAASSSSSATPNDTGSSYRRSSYLETPPKPSKEKTEDYDNKYPYASKYLSRTKTAVVPEVEESKTPFQSRFLNKSKSSALLGPNADVDNDDDAAPATSSRARFEELKKQRLAKSKSSAGVDDEDTPQSPTETSPSSRYSSRYGTSTTTTPSTGVSKSSTASSNVLGNSDATENGGPQLSNWARYLKNKYGNKNTSDTSTPASSSTGSSSVSPSVAASILGKSSTSGIGSSSSSSASTPSTRSSAISRSRSSHLLGLAKDDDDDSSKNVHATPITQAAADTPHPHTVVPTVGNIHRNQYLQKQLLKLKIGSRGSEPGNFTWPRGIAVGPDDTIVVADSSNHRVQVFGKEGNFVKDFGSYGNGEGEFDCLAGVTVNRIGQFIIADRYNHRVQIFDPSGMFLRSFGSQGSSNGKFLYPWGVATDSLGYIYVCDKENHRIQVFQSDGTFVGKFGSYGIQDGELQHPHYIAVSSTNRVIVSDSNNHRIQVFDVNGIYLSTFGGEGSDEGLFKYPRGVAVDEEGYIFVADSGNNRIQIFQADGTFIRTFGCWGSENGEFKGLEGVAVMPNGNILVGDRENHRIQMF